MSKSDRIQLTVLAGYVAIAFLIFGYQYNAIANRDCGPEPSILDNRQGWREWYDCDKGEYTAAPVAVFSGIAWPVWLVGKVALFVTKELPGAFD